MMRARYELFEISFQDLAEGSSHGNIFESDENFLDRKVKDIDDKVKEIFLSYK